VAREQRTVVGLLLEFVRLKELGYTAEEVNRCVSLLSTHAVKYTKRGGDGDQLGRALYPTFAFMSHSCDPVARHVTQPDGGIKVFAQRAIKEGEEVGLMDMLPHRLVAAGDDHLHLAADHPPAAPGQAGQPLVLHLRLQEVGGLVSRGEHCLALQVRRSHGAGEPSEQRGLPRLPEGAASRPSYGL
jgi:hypothetical protein